MVSDMFVLDQGRKDKKNNFGPKTIKYEELVEVS